MIRHAASLTLAVLLGSLTITPAAAQTVTLQRFLIADDPVSMAWTPDGSRLFFDEQATGNIRVAMADGTVLPQPFAHLDVDASSETGLLGVAVDPGFPEQPWIYVYFSDPTLGLNRLVRFRADGDVADGPPHLLLVGLASLNRYHNGGALVFGTDGMLYVTVGESHVFVLRAGPELDRRQGAAADARRLRAARQPDPGEPAVHARSSQLVRDLRRPCDRRSVGDRERPDE